jgi:hypothetical protein
MPSVSRVHMPHACAIALLALAAPASAQTFRDPGTGLAITPPAGYTAQAGRTPRAMA